MSCYHPNKAFRLGVKDNGKLDLALRSYNVDHLELVNGKWQNAYDSFVDPRSDRTVKDFIEVPCGKCLGCRMDYSRRWADRMMLEMEDHEESYFITLTYNDDHLPWNPMPDLHTGEIIDSVKTLRKEDLQKFIKRLRKQTGQDLMYFACGEYGEHTSRPHYHLIVFGLHLDDLQFFKKSNLGFNYYLSPFLDSVWSIGSGKQHANREPIGHVLVAPATWETCAYTARYVTKKADHDFTEYYNEHNIQPEFCIMSRRPAIAKNAFLKYIESGNVCYAKYSSIHLNTEKGGKTIQMPKYWDRLAEQIYPEIVAQKKLNRQMYAQENNLLKLENTDLSYLDQLQIEEHNLDARLRSLERNKI